MEKNKNLEPESGVLTSSMNVNNKEFKEFQLFLTQKAKSLNENEKLQVELFSLQMKIEDYLNSQDETQILTVGDFLRLYIDKLNLKQNRLAEYIGLRPANFSKILSGSRKVNFELSFTLSHIFSLDPKTWILIQVKNEYVELKREKAKYFQNFKLEELIKQ